MATDCRAKTAHQFYQKRRIFVVVNVLYSWYIHWSYFLYITRPWTASIVFAFGRAKPSLKPAKCRHVHCTTVAVLFWAMFCFCQLCAVLAIQEHINIIRAHCIMGRASCLCFPFYIELISVDKRKNIWIWYFNFESQDSVFIFSTIQIMYMICVCIFLFRPFVWGINININIMSLWFRLSLLNRLMNCILLKIWLILQQ